MDQLNSLTGEKLTSETIDNIFNRFKPSEVDEVQSDDVLKISSGFNKCKELEKHYFIKHIELYILSDESLKIYKSLNEYKDFYHELRKLKLDCVIETIRIPFLADLRGLVEQQQNKIKFVTDLNKKKKDYDRLKSATLSTSSVGGSRKVAYDSNTFEEVFQKFDEFMEMKKTDVKIDRVLQRKVVKSLNAGWKYNVGYWEDINQNYYDNIKNGIQIKSEDKSLVGVIKQTLINPEGETDIDGYDEAMKRLDEAIRDKEIELQRSTDTRDDGEIIESFFLKCKLYEYLYLKKHNEFLALFNLLITLIINLSISYIIIVLYLKTLTFDTCNNIEIPDSMIKQMQIFISGQNTLFSRVKDILEIINKTDKGITGGGKGRKTILTEDGHTLLGFLEQLQNLFKTAENINRFTFHTDAMENELDSLNEDNNISGLLRNIDDLNVDNYGYMEKDLQIFIENFNKEIKDLEKKIDEEEARTNPDQERIIQLKNDLEEKKKELGVFKNPLDLEGGGIGIGDQIKDAAQSILRKFNNTYDTKVISKNLSKTILEAHEDAFLKNLRNVLLVAKK